MMNFLSSLNIDVVMTRLLVLSNSDSLDLKRVVQNTPYESMIVDNFMGICGLLVCLGSLVGSYYFPWWKCWMAAFSRSLSSLLSVSVILRVLGIVS